MHGRFLAIITGVIAYGFCKNNSTSFCTSRYQLAAVSLHRCQISFTEYDGSTNSVSLHFDPCKDPMEVNFHKKTKMTNSAETSELIHTFTRADDKYIQSINGRLYSIHLRFSQDTTDTTILRVAVIVAIDDSERKLLEGNFHTNTDDCSWIDTLGHKERVAFIASMIALGFVIIAGFSIGLGVKLRKRVSQRKNKQLTEQTVTSEETKFLESQ